MKSALTFYKFIFKKQPLPFLILTSSSILTSLTESVGFSALLPFFFGGPLESGKISDIFHRFGGGIRVEQSSLLVVAIGFLALKVVFSVVVQFWAQYLTSVEEFKLSKKLSFAALGLDWQYFIERDSGYFNGVINREVTAFGNALFSGIRLFTEVLAGGAYLMVGIFLAPKAFLFLLPLLGGVPILKITSRNVKRGAGALLDLRLKLSGMINEFLIILKHSRIIGGDLWINAIQDNFTNAIRVRKKIILIESIVQNVPLPLVTIFLAILLKLLQKYEHIVNLDYAMFIAVVYRSYSNFVASAQTFQSFSGYLPGFFHCIDSLRDWEMNARFENKHGIQLLKIERIQFEDVSFGYQRKKGELVFKHLSFNASLGDIVGLVGPSGVGKSTILNMILGVIQPNEGRILINGIDLRDYNTRSLHDAIKLVSQEPILKKGLISDVLTGFRCLLPSEQKEYFSKLGLDSIDLDLQVNELARNLSGGQRQRLAILDIYLKFPKIILLDEPTSNLGDDTETKVLEFILENRLDRITIISTHNENTKWICNKFIQLEEKGRGN